FLANIVGIAFIAEVTRAHIEECTLVTPHQLFVRPRDMKQLDVRALHQLLVRELAGVVARGERLGLVQNDSCRQSGRWQRRPATRVALVAYISRDWRLSGC